GSVAATAPGSAGATSSGERGRLRPPVLLPDSASFPHPHTKAIAEVIRMTSAMAFFFLLLPVWAI
ncbi:MAG TPA: hypothetical protein VF099_10420, partial [Ktedonobacterales bacterium]